MKNQAGVPAVAPPLIRGQLQTLLPPQRNSIFLHLVLDLLHRHSCVDIDHNVVVARARALGFTSRKYHDENKRGKANYGFNDEPDERVRVLVEPGFSDAKDDRFGLLAEMIQYF